MRVIKANLSSESLDNLISELKAYRDSYDEKVWTFLRQLAEVCRDSLQTDYDQSVAMANAARDVSWLKRGDRAGWSVMPIEVSVEPAFGEKASGYVISANGSDVCFIEFGAGMFAGNPTNEYADRVPISIQPGSWSDAHAETWKHWVGAGRPKNEYPYNIFPANAFPKAYNKMANSVHPLARAIFGERH